MLEQGQGGLLVAFDLPTQLGLDSDHISAQGEVGVVGVAVDSLHDMETIFRGLPLEQASPSLTMNAAATVALAMYVAVAETEGLEASRITGTTQNDILKEFLARGNYIFPPRPSLRLTVDLIQYCTEHLPRWNFMNVCGYHLREAGATLIQEVAFAVADAITYIEACLARGLDIDDFAPRIAFNFTATCNIFEEAAKFRATRRLWARVDARALRGSQISILAVASRSRICWQHFGRSTAGEQYRSGCVAGARRRTRWGAVVPRRRV